MAGEGLLAAFLATYGVLSDFYGDIRAWQVQAALVARALGVLKLGSATAQSRVVNFSGLVAQAAFLCLFWGNGIVTVRSGWH